MESPTVVAALAAAAGAAATLLLVALVRRVRRRHHSRVELEAMLAAAHREMDDLRHRLEELTAQRDGRPVPAGRSTRAGSSGPELLAELFPGSATGAPREPQQAEFVITRAGEPEATEQVEVPDRLVLSATLGEPLVKVVAFSHGVRRALSPEVRNRIRFEMRREVRASRRRRRQLRKRLEREHRAHGRAEEMA